ncbi:MAG TPA: archaeosine biosynthesis radical SAM protein RaSEA [Methanoregulaceae archaeon]|nr:MAG: archaeosine biosynthesis radical SAM protein RaSEA [Methanolinea sp.]HON80890.1 archaeosine biosynthesis radical SAM protein RaSEA [Methanoregulaceae archaeon]HPD09627.1 archaeosine biosynthesis radical SAM protein RaSEA [Methanoregulaceae archaeon]HRT15296.1 archaeosine biosynthesis radical SAM protein RaSEA [Methanoregulaceae archaeon]HRU30867.1 archaeosine biosynthesis radical SAM protein RaSEA [Methanoregulaceae archaeon]
MKRRVRGVMEKPLACWEGRDYYQGEALPSLTIILRTGGCRHNRCRMCSYRFERYTGHAPGNLASLLISQLDWVKDHHNLEKVRMVKIYTSGSFFDPDEVPPGVVDAVARLFRGKLVIAETRPEFINAGRLEEFLARVDTGEWETPLMVAMGLETTSDFIREKCIDKGFSWQDFLSAAGVAHASGAGVKAYLLHKPLFLTEHEALVDMEKSIRTVSGFADTISLNPCTVQRHTELESYWKKGAYRPPYLWSVLSLLISAPVFVTCDPVGGGRSRGPHNCGICDREIVRAIRDFSLSNDRELLIDVFEKGCHCRAEWEYILSGEHPYCMPLSG